MSDAFHEGAYLGSGCEATTFALHDYRCGEFEFLGLENGILVQTDYASVNSHIEEYRVCIYLACWKSEVGREAERCVKEYIVYLPVVCPEIAIQVIVFVVVTRPV